MGLASEWNVEERETGSLIVNGTAKAGTVLAVGLRRRVGMMDGAVSCRRVECSGVDGIDTGFLAYAHSDGYVCG